MSTSIGADIAAILGSAAWDAHLSLSDIHRQKMEASVAALAAHRADGRGVYGVTQGFGPLVGFAAADSESEQGRGLIAHLATGQGAPLAPDVSRLAVRLRLDGMRKGYSAVSPSLWLRLADFWNAGFTPVMPSHGTVSASGDLQPLAHAALAFAGEGEAWRIRPGETPACVPALAALRALDASPIEWRARDALAFVNGTSVSLAQALVNQEALLAIVRAAASLTGRIVTVLGSSLEAYDDGLVAARGHPGHRVAAAWIRAEASGNDRPTGATRLQEPYSLRCAPQVIGAILDTLQYTEEILAREARGCSDNPVIVNGRVLHGGNFHAMPVGLCSDQAGLCLQQVAFLAERQLAVLCDPASNGGLSPMLTPRPGRGSGVAGVQLSATSFVARIRQLVYPSGLTSLPTNLGNQDHVPMALNGALSVREALSLAWLVLGSLAVGVTQGAAIAGRMASAGERWSEFADVSPPLVEDRPFAQEVRQSAGLLEAWARTDLRGARDADRTATADG